MAPEKVIRPNLPEYAQQLKLYATISGVMIAVCFISFAVVGASGGEGLILLPFFGFGGFGFLTAMLSAKYAQADALVQVMRQIQASKYIKIKDISYKYALMNADKVYAIKLLIESGNLADYEIKDDIVIRKGEVYKEKEEKMDESFGARAFQQASMYEAESALNEIELNEHISVHEPEIQVKTEVIEMEVDEEPTVIESEPTVIESEPTVFSSRPTVKEPDKEFTEMNPFERAMEERREKRGYNTSERRRNVSSNEKGYSVAFCPRCGASVSEKDSFCAKCGKKL
jgi:rubrerythrin